MKHLLLILALLPFYAIAQHSTLPTDEFRITGWVEKEVTWKLENIEKLVSHEINDYKVLNHRGEVKATFKSMRGVLLKDLLEQAALKIADEKGLNAVYFTCIASDGYKVVYSWNELFNSPTGENTVVVTEKDGKDVAQSDDRLLLITASDRITGRRHLCGLSRIVVSKSE